jgi:hypothetical protein
MRRASLWWLLLLPSFGFTNCSGYFTNVTVPTADTTVPVLATRMWIGGVESLSLGWAEEVITDPADAVIVIAPGIWDSGGAKTLQVTEHLAAFCSDGFGIDVAFLPQSTSQSGGPGSVVSNGMYLLGRINDLSTAHTCPPGHHLTEVEGDQRPQHGAHLPSGPPPHGGRVRLDHHGHRLLRQRRRAVPRRHPVPAMRGDRWLLLAVAPCLGFTDCSWFSTVTVAAGDTTRPVLATRMWIGGVESTALGWADEYVTDPADAASVVLAPGVWDSNGARTLTLDQGVSVYCHNDDEGLGQISDEFYFQRGEVQPGGVGSSVRTGIYLIGDVTDLARYEGYCYSGFDLVDVTYYWSLTGTDYAGNAADPFYGTLVYEP